MYFKATGFMHADNGKLSSLSACMLFYMYAFNSLWHCSIAVFWYGDHRQYIFILYACILCRIVGCRGCSAVFAENLTLFMLTKITKNTQSIPFRRPNKRAHKQRSCFCISFGIWCTLPKTIFFLACFFYTSTLACMHFIKHRLSTV